MIFVTGDIHGSLGINRFNFDNWSESRELTKSDYLIICGDFGLLWNDPSTAEENYWLDWLSKKPWTTLFLDGNHENFDMLEKLPILDSGLFGNALGVVRESVYHLRRGNVYNINGKTFFCMGGAVSIDKEGGGIYLTPDGQRKIIKPRVEGISWWKQEVPSYLEFEHGFNSLEACKNEVDYVITHTAPNFVVKKLFGDSEYLLCNGEDPTTLYFDELFKKVKYRKWYCGHFHKDVDYEDIHFLNERILEVEC